MAKTKRIGGADWARLRKLAAGRYWGERDGPAALAAFEASGLTQLAFRKATGITPQRLAWWRRRIAVGGEDGKIEFVPVEVMPRITSAAGDDAVMEIVLGDARVRGSSLRHGRAAAAPRGSRGAGVLSFPSTVRVYLCAYPVDLRKSFDGLAVATRQVIGEDPLCGGTCSSSSTAAVTG